MKKCLLTFPKCAIWAWRGHMGTWSCCWTTILRSSRKTGWGVWWGRRFCRMWARWEPGCGMRAAGWSSMWASRICRSARLISWWLFRTIRIIITAAAVWLMIWSVWRRPAWWWRRKSTRKWADWTKPWRFPTMTWTFVLNYGRPAITMYCATMWCSIITNP